MLNNDNSSSLIFPLWYCYQEKYLRTPKCMTNSFAFAEAK